MKDFANILLLGIDDDEEDVELLEDLLKELSVQNYKLHTKEEDFVENLNASINVVLIDHRLRLTTGLELIKKVKCRNEDNYVMIMSDTRDFEVAVEYLNNGADKFLQKSDRDYRGKFTNYLRVAFETAQRRTKKAQDEAEFQEYKKGQINAHLDNTLKTIEELSNAGA